MSKREGTIHAIVVMSALALFHGYQSNFGCEQRPSPASMPRISTTPQTPTWIQQRDERLRQIRELRARTQAELEAARAERERLLDEMLRQMEAQRERLSRLNDGRHEPPRFPSVSDTRAVYEEILNRFGRPEARTYHHQNNLAQLYASYSVDASGELTWDDVERFHRGLMAKTQYIHQRRALHPSEFHATGGGNCVDYSLATADFLSYFGIPVVIGGFFAEGDVAGHALVLVPVQKVPAGYTPVVLNNDVRMNGRVFAAGTYIPIDYQYVGGFSNATAPNARLTNLWHPQDMIGGYF